jgi:hypothetical protein
MSAFRTSRVHVSMSRDMIDVTCGIPTASETWRYTDTNGHEHYYEHGYPTLDFIIDEQHWCNGDEGYASHDPHMAIDAAHYECKLCKVTVEPGVDPAFTPKYTPGMTTCTISGVRDDGLRIEAHLTQEEGAQFVAHPTEETAVRLLNAIPLNRCTSIRQA